MLYWLRAQFCTLWLLKSALEKPKFNIFLGKVGEEEVRFHIHELPSHPLFVYVAPSRQTTLNGQKWTIEWLINFSFRIREKVCICGGSRTHMGNPLINVLQRLHHKRRVASCSLSKNESLNLKILALKKRKWNKLFRLNGRFGNNLSRIYKV